MYWSLKLPLKSVFEYIIFSFIKRMIALFVLARLLIMSRPVQCLEKENGIIFYFYKYKILFLLVILSFDKNIPIHNILIHCQFR